MKRPKYDFEKLEVYQQAMAFAEEMFEMREEFPQRAQSSLGDQGRRAVLSICSNIAEGSRKPGPSRRQYYGYALDSARECVPIVELSFRRKLISADVYERLDESCFRISSMMFALLRSVR